MEIRMKALAGLQRCDNRIREIQSRRLEGPLKIQMLEEGLNLIENQLRDELARLQSCKEERRKIEHDIEDFENKINKSNIKLSNIKSNKEYSAVLKEISDLKGERSVLEDRVIELMEEIEALEESLVASKEEKARQEERVRNDKGEILRELKALEEELENLEMERAQFTKNIDQDLLRMYDLLRLRKGGIAVSPVIQGVCQRCHMGIPPQVFNNLIRGDELMNCPNCKRIIYWGGDQRFQDIAEKEQ